MTDHRSKGATRSPTSRRTLVAVLAGLALLATVLAGSPASAAPRERPRRPAPGTSAKLDVLPAPPHPPAGLPTQPIRQRRPTSPAPSHSLRAATAAAVPPSAVTWGQAGGDLSTLVVYDSTEAWGWLGEMYGLAAGNLASHFGTVTAQPVLDYVAGQIADHTATIYIGSTYNEPLPQAFVDDVLATSHPVLWAGSNVWQLAGTPEAAAGFQAVYGWDPTTSYFADDQVASVHYGTTALTRNPAAGSILAPHVTTPAAVQVLAEAECSDTTGPVACSGIAQTTGTTFPWAIRSANMTYLGESPFSYLSERDRYLVFADLLFDVLDPGAAKERKALVRLEDVSPGTSSPAQLRAAADYLAARDVPFSVAVIADFVDPEGALDGTPAHLSIADVDNPTVAAFNNALRYMVSKGGTLIQHGTTHQLGTAHNPYNAVSGDDFEFYRASCSPQKDPPHTFNATCADTDWVIHRGPVPGDSADGAESIVRRGHALFAAAGLPMPVIFETPHYAASAADYVGMRRVYSTRYERMLFPSGVLKGAPDYDRVFGQLFPYVVHDPFGSTVLPESLGNPELEAINNNPPKGADDIVANAKAQFAVRQGVASFFFHPYYPLSVLSEIVEGIQSAGFTFVPATSLLDPGVLLSVGTAALPEGRVGTPYAATLTATGTSGVPTWTVVDGALPGGLQLAPDGTISGTPMTAGTSSVTVEVQDGSASATSTLSIVVTPGPLTITTRALPGAQTGVAYTATLGSTGGKAPIRWARVSGTFPTGLVLGVDGTLTGVPQVVATKAVTVRATAADGETVTGVVTIQVSKPLAITTASLRNGKVGASYGVNLQATGGSGTRTWAVTDGALPAGITLAPSGSLTGTPVSPGISSVIVSVVDGTGRASKAYSLTVAAAPLRITTTSVATGKVGRPYQAQLSATGGTGPVRWSVASGTLPAGLRLDASTGVLLGTPTGVARRVVVFRATDAAAPPHGVQRAIRMRITR